MRRESAMLQFSKNWSIGARGGRGAGAIQALRYSGPKAPDRAVQALRRGTSRGLAPHVPILKEMTLRTQMRRGSSRESIPPETKTDGAVTQRLRSDLPGPDGAGGEQ